jgi:hypothetical protein
MRCYVGEWNARPIGEAIDPSVLVYVCCLNEKGRPVCKCITEHPKFQKWKDEFSPGEMWSMFGEDWLCQ